MNIYGFQNESMVIDPGTPQVPNIMFQLLHYEVMGYMQFVLSTIR